MASEAGIDNLVGWSCLGLLFALRAARACHASTAQGPYLLPA